MDYYTDEASKVLTRQAWGWVRLIIWAIGGLHEVAATNTFTPEQRMQANDIVQNVVKTYHALAEQAFKSGSLRDYYFEFRETRFSMARERRFSVMLERGIIAHDEYWRAFEIYCNEHQVI